MRPDVDILKQMLENKEIERIHWIPDELMIADVLTKEKVTKIGVFELMAYGKLKVVTNEDNYIHHDSKDFCMKGKHLRSTIIKAKKTPIKKRKKGSLLAKQELENMKEDDMLKEEDVCWIELESGWEIDDSYRYYN